MRTKFGEQLLMHSGAKRLSEGIDRTEDEITAESRYGVWMAWGILPDHQVALENHFRSMQIEYGNLVVGSYDEIPNPTLY